MDNRTEVEKLEDEFKMLHCEFKSDCRRNPYRIVMNEKDILVAKNSEYYDLMTCSLYGIEIEQGRVNKMRFK